jgi:hypothetical protein
MWVLIFSAFVVVVARQSSPGERAARFQRRQSHVINSIPLNVEVTLAGIPENEVPYRKLEHFLTESFGSYFPSRTVTQTAGLNISYRVVSAPDNLISSYRKFISSHAVSGGTFTVPVEALRESINDALGNSIAGSLSSFRLVILQDDKLPKHRILASHNDDEQDCTQVVLANIAFLDLSATACDRFIHSSRADSHVVWHSFNYRHPWPLSFVPEHQVRWLPEPMKDIENHRVARLHAIVVSAIKSIAVTRIDEVESNAIKAFAPRLLVPVYVFHNGDSNHGDTQIDTSAVKSRLEKFLPPGHDLSVMHVIYHAGEIPEVSVAVAESMRVAPRRSVDDLGEEVTVDIPHFNTEILWRAIKTKIGNLNNKFAGAAFHDVIAAGYYYMSEMIDNDAAEHASIPIVILADFHSRVAGAPKMVLPLFEDNSAVSVIPGEAVLVSYSSIWKYSIFDETASSGKWTTLQHLRIEDVILQAALEAIVNLKAPHLQRAAAPDRIIDMTWAENNDPLWALAPPIGCNRRAPRPERSILEWTSIRSLTLSFTNANTAAAWSHFERFDALVRALEAIGSEDSTAADLATVWEAEDFGLFNHEDVASLKFPPAVISVIDSMKHELTVIQELAQFPYDFKNEDLSALVASLHDVKARIEGSSKSLEDLRFKLIDEFSRCYLSTSRGVFEDTSARAESNPKSKTKSAFLLVSVLLVFCALAAIGLWYVMKTVTYKAKKLA